MLRSDSLDSVELVFKPYDFTNLMSGHFYVFFIGSVKRWESNNKHLILYAVCMSVYGMCVCVCVCVCVYTLPPWRLLPIARSLDGYGSAMSCCEYYSRCFCQVPSFPFLNMSCFTSEGKTPARRKLKRKWYDTRFPEKMVYIYTGYKSPNWQVTKRY